MNLSASTPTPASAPAPVVTPAPTATPTPATKPSIADVAKNISIPDYTEDPTLAALGAGYKKTATETVDEEAIRRQTRERMQAQIDAINQVYNQKKNEARVQGQGRIGTTTAINARSGLLGSDFGAANTQTTENYNNEILSSIDAEQMAKVNAILTEAERDASSEIAAKRAAIEQGATKYLEYLGQSETRKKAAASNIAKSLFAQGIDPNSLTADQISKISASYGMTIDEFKSVFADVKSKDEAEKRKAQEDQAKIDKATAEAEKALSSVNSFELNDGQQRYVFDPKTGKAELVATNQKEFAPNKYSGGGSSGGSGSGSGGGRPAVGPDGKFLDYYDPNYTITAIRNSKGGRFLTQSELKPINDIKQVVGQAETLTGLIKTVDTGPFLGIIRSNNPYDTKAQNMKAAITAIVPKLARGVYGEVGVLTDQDIANYSRTIANLKNTNDVNKAVMAMTLEIAQRSLANQIQTMAEGKRDVSQFEPAYLGISNKVKELKSSIGYGQAPTTSAQTGGATVKVKNPNTGQVITIPEANLSKALSKGYIKQ